MEKIDYSEAQSLSYYYFEKGDIERWVDWPEARAILQRDHPEIIFAYDQMVNTRKIFDAVLESFCNKIHEE